jgi:hypothetical protein
VSVFELDFLIRTILDEGYKYEALYYVIFSSSRFGPDVLPNTFFSDTFNPFLRVGDRVLHPRSRSTAVTLIF